MQLVPLLPYNVRHHKLFLRLFISQKNLGGTLFSLFPWELANHWTGLNTDLGSQFVAASLDLSAPSRPPTFAFLTSLTFICCETSKGDNFPLSHLNAISFTLFILSDRFTRGIHIKIMYQYFVSHIRDTYYLHFNALEFMTLPVGLLEVSYNTGTSSLCNINWLLPLPPNIFLSNLWDYAFLWHMEPSLSTVKFIAYTLQGLLYWRKNRWFITWWTSSILEECRLLTCGAV